jgi:hypothetical protein
MYPCRWEFAMRARVILSVSKDGFCGSVDRSKSPFDGLRMISRSTSMSRFKSPLERIHYQGTRELPALRSAGVYGIICGK